MYARPSDENIEKWEKLISDFAVQNRIEFKVKSDITSICKNLGFTVLALENDYEAVDGVILVNKNEKIIGITNKADAEDARFIIAHELSHYISKRIVENGDLKFAFKDKHIFGQDKDEIENQMDYMAAAILVPRDKFVDYLNNFNIKNCRNIDDVKKNVRSIIIDFLAFTFNVKNDVIVRRIVEVS